VNANDFKKINDYLWEYPAQDGMLVPARIYATDEMMNRVEPDALRQVVNVAHLPGIVNYSIAMPDIHTGYGFVIGGVAATKVPDGVISPGGIGYDQNCGTRLLLSEHTAKEMEPYLLKLANQIQRDVPSGLGRGTGEKMTIEEVDKILERGVEYLVEKGYGEKEDIENCESQGKMKEARPDYVSKRAKNRGRDQVGTLGSGNHFLEIQRVDEVFDKEVAKAFGLFKDQLVIFEHTGSRGLGHQNCTDYLRIMVGAMEKYGIKLPDKELASVPFSSKEGQQFFGAMAAAANYAWANRQMITHFIRGAWDRVVGKGKLKLLYDVAHNIAKVEDGLVVHRKGATRAFPPGHLEVPVNYRAVGQPALIPGSMGTASYIMVGTERGKEVFYSTAHGAGRAMSRRAAKEAATGAEIKKELESKGIIVRCRSMRGIAEEAPLAYKDIESVVKVAHEAGLSKKVARLVPLAVIKGE